MENEEYIESGLSVGTVKIANKYEIFTEEEVDAINNKIPELDERVGNIESDIEEINSSLDNIEIIKADKTTTNNIQQQVNNLVLGAVGDGNNAEIIQARGEFTTLNGRLDFMDSSHLKNTSANLVNSYLSKGVNTNGVTIEKIDEITYKATCTQSWGGTFNNRIKVSPNKIYMVICKVKATDENSVGKYCHRTTYQYSVNSTNLGGSSLVYSDYSQARIALTNDYKYIYYCETPNHEDVDYIDFGITGEPNSSFIATEYVILDVTNLTLEGIKAIDFVNREYWHNYIENFNISNYSLKAEESVIALDLKEDVKNSLITNASELAIKESNIYTNWKISKALAMPFIEESNKLDWTKKEMSTGSSASWWIQNNTTRLEPNSTYLYTVKMKTNTNVTFDGCCELRNGAWYNDSTVTIGSSGSIPFIAKTWIFKTDDKVTSPILCCRTKNETLTDNLTLEVELFRVIDEQYTTKQFCTELAKVYREDKNINDYNFSEKIKWREEEGIIQASNKLTWSTKTYLAGTSTSWWVENKTKDLLPNSTYLYIVKWEGQNQNAFQRCNELRDGKWHEATTFTNRSATNDNIKVVSWIFTTDDVVTSPSLCCVTSNPTLDIDTTITVELYRIANEEYINTTFATDIARAYRDGNVINDYDFSEKIKWGEQEGKIHSKWKGKNVLVIGDSITAAGQWQLKLRDELGMNVTTHAKGGIGIIAMVDGDKGLQGNYDNETSASGTLYPLNADKVKDKDLIVVLPAYNERHAQYGEIGDLYPTQSNITGQIQYMINRIYEELTKADNLNCKVLFATPHCAGKYNYVDYDGYQEYPEGSGRTMEGLSDTIKKVCNYNNIPVCDLWHNSGINRFTWTIYGANPNAINSQYSRYQLNENGEAISTTPMRYTTGNSYYQVRDGVVVLEKYTGSAPFPFNGDQLHCSNLGYARIGECIIGSIIRAYGY